MVEQPIETDKYAAMNEIARLLNDRFRGFGFALLVFDFESDEGRMNYISNAERANNRL